MFDIGLVVLNFFHAEATVLSTVLNYLLTYLLTYLLHGAESFLKS